MKKLLPTRIFSKVLSVMLLWFAMVYASDDFPDPFEQTEAVLNTAASVVYYVIGMVTAVLALSPLMFGAVMGYKSYQQAKEMREGNPTTAGVKTFTLWVVITGLIAFFAYYIINKLLGGALGKIILSVLGLD